jgi:hypothetical protein
MKEGTSTTNSGSLFDGCVRCVFDILAVTHGRAAAPIEEEGI